jgi:phospholipid-binding lipoprotein MlaA
MINRAFKNLGSPVILANHMLQFRVVAAATTTTRFVINSSIGLAGLFDPAANFFEVYRIEGDFGQTLARYGSPSGPFLMLPLFGPSTMRDVFGDVVDILADPVSYVLGPYAWWTLLLGGSEGLSSRESHLADLQALEADSVDFYSALRSAYLQSRDAMVREARSESLTGGVATRERAVVDSPGAADGPRERFELRGWLSPASPRHPSASSERGATPSSLGMAALEARGQHEGSGTHAPSGSAHRDADPLRVAEQEAGCRSLECAPALAEDSAQGIGIGARN